jgi:hypothetical protein
MSDLRSEISAACSDLEAVTTALSKIRHKGTLSQESYQFFELLPTFSAQTADIRGLLDARDSALSALASFPDQINPDDRSTFLLSGVAIPFRHGRLLLVQSYMASTWVVYDTLTKIGGTLFCTDERAKNTAKPVKLQEDFIGGRNTVGARVQDHLKGAYGWPIGVSYAIRNWVLHDGHAHEGIELFRYNSHDVAPFEISGAAWDKIVERCTQKYKVEETHTRLQPFPDVRANIVDGLRSCHQEIDEAVSFALRTATGGIRLQAQLLFERDL